MNTSSKIAVQDVAQQFLQTYPDDRAARHFAVLFLLEAGVSKTKVGELTNYSSRQVYNIDKAGISALTPSPNKGGRNRIFEGSAFTSLLTEIVAQPTASPQTLADQLSEKYGIQVSGKTIERELPRRELEMLPKLIQQEIEREISRYQHSILTSFGGAFLLIPLLLKQKFMDKAETAFQGLTRVTSMILLLLMLQIFGFRRLFHLEHLSDRGLAFLTGRPALYSRQHVHHWLKQMDLAGVKAFYQQTRPDVETILGQPLEISFDEHVIARWTKKVELSGTKHPTRGKAMKADKLFYAFDLARKKLLSFLPQKGNRTLAQITLSMLRELIETYQPSDVRLTLDAGGCKGNTIARLVQLCQRLEKESELPLIFSIRGRSYPNLKKEWVSYIAGHPLKEVIHPDDEALPVKKQRRFHVGETTTKISGCGTPLRTILTAHSSNAGGEKGDDLYVIYTNDDDAPQQVAIRYRERQNHELCFRVMGHDLNLDALPKSYSTNAKPKEGKKANFLSKGIMFFGWLKACAFNLIQDFKNELPEKYHTMTVGTIMLKFLRKNAVVFVNDEEIKVVFEPFKEQEALRKYIEQCNAQNIRLPWLKNKRLCFQLRPCPMGNKSEIGFDP